MSRTRQRINLMHAVNRWRVVALGVLTICATADPVTAWDLHKWPDSAATTQVENGLQLTFRCSRGRNSVEMTLSDISGGTDLSAPLRDITTSGGMMIWIRMPDGGFSQDAFTGFNEQGSVAASIPVDQITWDSFANGEQLWIQDTGTNDALFTSGMKGTGAARLAFLERCGF